MQPSRNRSRRTNRNEKRGVASVLSMMFMVLFSSLAVAMAIVSQGNLRTAATHLQVVRSMGSTETGLAIAAHRLNEACERFVIERGTVDAGFGERVWSGNVSGGDISAGGDGVVDILPPRSGFSESTTPSGIVEALANAFEAEQNVIEFPDAPTEPTIHAAPSGTDLNIFASSDWLTTPVYALEDDGADPQGFPPGFQVTYAPLADGVTIRVIVTGYSAIGNGNSSFSYDYDAENERYRPVTRVVQQDFQILKRHDHAMLSPSRIMIGKNVQVSGKLGSLFGDVAANNGHPIVMKSDFRSIDPILDDKLDAFYAAIVASDADGDNRLRSNHAIEGAGIPLDADFDGDGTDDGAFDDITQDGYVDEYDIFLSHFDSNGDGKVVLSSALTDGTPADGLSPEFEVDDDLALLIDSSVPDRNGNSIYGFIDDDGDGQWDSDETLLDYDNLNHVYPDQVLGYRDGVLDKMDRYSKVRGRLVFDVTQAAWTAAQGDYQQFIEGAIASADGSAPVEFNAGEEDLPRVTQASFTNSETPLKAIADGSSFESQVASQIGVSVGTLGTYVESDTNSASPRYFRVDLDDSYVYGMTGQHLYERMPFNSPTYVDYYYRPRYENMTFRDVQIPRGTNALFVNCTFVGVTWVRTYTDNNHGNWMLYGKMEWDDTTGQPEPITDPLDKSDFLRYTTGNITDGPENYDDFLDPPVIDGETKLDGDRDTKLYSNNVRFHDCLFIGSLVSDTPEEYTHVRNKFQFTGSTRFLQEHPTEPENPDFTLSASDLEEIEKSSLMVPNYSVDIGQFNSPTDTHASITEGQDVQLQGTIVAGILDVRGNASIDGSLMLTFAPVAGEGPLQQNGVAVGNPAGFNATIGYFGPEDGDGESLDPDSLPIVDGERIVGWDLDADGLPDLGPDDVPTSEQIAGGATAVPFYGYGRISLNWNPDLPMPDGIMLPMSADIVATTYKEGR